MYHHGTHVMRCCHVNSCAGACAIRVEVEYDDSLVGVRDSDPIPDRRSCCHARCVDVHFVTKRRVVDVPCKVEHCALAGIFERAFAVLPPLVHP